MRFVLYTSHPSAPLPTPPTHDWRLKANETVLSIFERFRHHFSRGIVPRTIRSKTKANLSLFNREEENVPNCTEYPPGDHSIEGSVSIWDLNLNIASNHSHLAYTP